MPITYTIYILEVFFKMFKCKDCNTPMERVYIFDEKGNSAQVMKCPMCGGHTKLRPIEYDNNGNLINRHNSGKPRRRKKVEK